MKTEDVEKWVEEMSTVPRDEFGLTEAQREGVELEAKAILLDWRPRVLFLAEKLGVTEEVALSYNRLIIEFRMMKSQECQERMAAEYLARENEGDEWKPEE